MQTNKQNSPSQADTEDLQDKIVEDLHLSASELKGLWKELLKLQALTQQWSTSTLELFVLELTNSVAAFKRLIVCHVLFIGLLFLFLFSVPIGAGVVSYHFTLSLIIGYGTFMLVFALMLVGLVMVQKYLMQFIGFHYTKDQIKEGINVCTQRTAASNTNQKA
jgi:hypothetical protein